MGSVSTAQTCYDMYLPGTVGIVVEVQAAPGEEGLVRVLLLRACRREASGRYEVQAVAKGATKQAEEQQTTRAYPRRKE